MLIGVDIEMWNINPHLFIANDSLIPQWYLKLLPLGLEAIVVLWFEC